MANISRVNGFRPVKHLDGSPWNSSPNRYVVVAADTVAIFNGDLVTLTGTTDSFGTQGVRKWVPGGTDQSNNVPILGVAVGFSINPLNLNSPQYRLASTQSYVLVVDEPTVVYEVQSTAAANPTDLNLNVQVTDSNGSTVTGMSGETVGTGATTATFPLKMLGASQKIDNDLTSTNYKVLVMINNSPYNGNGAVGI